MGIGYILLIIFGAYAALKFYKTQKVVNHDLANRGSLQPGVSYYCNLAVTQRPAQVLAAQQSNGDATSAGFAPAFGPAENMPPDSQEVFF